MKPVWVITFGLASLLASPISAHSPIPNGAAAQKSNPPVKMQAPHAAATHTGAAKDAGSARTLGYLENDMNAVKFGSKDWWTIQGWNSGVSR